MTGPEVPKVPTIWVLGGLELETGMNNMSTTIVMLLDIAGLRAMGSRPFQKIQSPQGAQYGL